MAFMLLTICILSFLEMAMGSDPVDAHLQCPALRTTSMKFSLFSRRNETGHWTSDVMLGHNAGQPNLNTGPWQVDVEQSTKQCGEGVETVLITAIITAPPQVVVPGYTLLPGHGYYRVHKIPATWEEARQTCVDEGAQLLILNSAAEATAVQAKLLSNLQITSTSDNYFLHIGFHDLYEEGQYTTVLGQPLSSTGYTTWRAHEPNNNGNEDCGSIHVSVTLNDVSCSKRLYFICEKGL